MSKVIDFFLILTLPVTFDYGLIVRRLQFDELFRNIDPRDRIIVDNLVRRLQFVRRVKKISGPTTIVHQGILASWTGIGEINR